MAESEHVNKNNTTRSQNTPLNEEEQLSTAPEQDAIGLIHHLPLDQMKPKQIMNLQRKFGNQFVLNLARSQQLTKPNPIQRTPMSASISPAQKSIQRDDDDGEDPEEYKAKAEAEHDKHKALDIAPTFYVTAGDSASFFPTFADAIVMVTSAPVVATGTATIDGRAVAVEGDENLIMVASVPYITPMHTIPGMGTLKIQHLTADHYVSGATAGGRRLLQKGGIFTAIFEVVAPAMSPPMGTGAPIADPNPMRIGNGHFITTSNPLASPEGLDPPG